MSDFLSKFGEDLKNNVSGFIAVSITEVKTGISYYSLSANSSFDPELASAYNLEVVKAKLNAIKALGLDQKIENIINTKAEYLISTDSSCLMHLDGRMKFNGNNVQILHLADVLASGY